MIPDITPVSVTRVSLTRPDTSLTVNHPNKTRALTRPDTGTDTTACHLQSLYDCSDVSRAALKPSRRPGRTPAPIDARGERPHSTSVSIDTKVTLAQIWADERGPVRAQPIGRQAARTGGVVGSRLCGCDERDVCKVVERRSAPEARPGSGAPPTERRL